MKRIAQTIGIAFLALALVLVAPRAYEHLLPVNNSAALALSSSKSETVGKSVVECLNQHNRSGVWWGLNSVDYLKAHENLGGSWSPSHYVIAGRLGWHVTWTTILPLTAGLPTAYETFGADNSFDGSRFRTELPIRIVGSLKQCGASFNGVYPGALPFEM